MARATTRAVPLVGRYLQHFCRGSVQRRCAPRDREGTRTPQIAAMKTGWYWRVRTEARPSERCCHVSARQLPAMLKSGHAAPMVTRHLCRGLATRHC